MSQDLGISKEEAIIIENGYKDLHPGIYTYGENKLEEVIEKGYIHYCRGFRLHLPYFEEFRSDHEWMQGLSKSFWTQYSKGKKEYAKYKRAKEKGLEYEVKEEVYFNIYRHNAKRISKYFKKRGEYFRLCLNGETQSVAAHQTKAAMNKIFEHIWKKKHFWKARLSLAIHDELFLEVADELVEEYKLITENSMKEEGNKFLTEPQLFMNCKANAGPNWYKAK